MADSNTDFTYVSILRELEKAVASASGKETPKVGAKLTRANNLLRGTKGPDGESSINPGANLLRGFTDILSYAVRKIESGSKSISKKLEVTEKAVRDFQEERLINLSSWTQSHTRYETGKATAWPPLVPVGLTVEKFIGTTIGLHSESPDEPFTHHLQTSLAETVVPTLAWGLWCQLQQCPPEIRAQAAEMIAKSITDEREASGDRAKVLLISATKNSVEIPYLRLVHGWAHVVGQTSAAWALKPDEVIAFRHKIRLGFEQSLKDPAAELSGLLLHHYGSTDHGSERARVIEMAHRRSQLSSGFWRKRLSLLSGAQSKELEHFRHLVRTNVQSALDDARAFIADETSGRKNYGEEACGRAFWLARLTYGKHSSNGMLEGQASTLTLKLLTSAARSFSSDNEKRAYCLRFAAGYATNPRYFRSDFVLDKIGETISAYGREPKYRPGLLSLFKARAAWQEQSCEKGRSKRDVSTAAKLYNQALEGAIGSSTGLDAEAHVHLFPELYVFLDEFSTDGGGSKKVLSVIDYVVQNNFGVYFDATVEAELIKNGISQYRDRHERRIGEVGPESAVRSLAKAKEAGDHIATEILERKIRASNASKPRTEEDTEE